MEASKTGTTIRWWYDFAGQRRWKVTEISGEPDRVYKYPLATYQERDGNPTWTLVAGGSMLGEVHVAPKPVPELDALDNLITYAHDPGSGLPPDPWDTDAVSLEAALQAYWSGQPVGPSEEVGRYFHRDHLGGPAHVTSTAGELISLTTWHPYGLESHRRGFQPNYTFTGAEREPERDLGLIQMGARWLAPALGRWVSADPLFLQTPGKSVESTLEMNLYSYALNNPTVFTDPTGLTTMGQIARLLEDEHYELNRGSGATEPSPVQLTDFLGIAGIVRGIAKGVLSYFGRKAVKEIGEEVAERAAKEVGEKVAKNVGESAAEKASRAVALTAGRSFKAHFGRARSLVQKALGVKIGKLKDGGGDELLGAIGKGIDDGIFKSVGQGTLKKGSEVMNIFRGEGVTIVTKMSGEFVTALKSGQALDKAIQFLP